MLFAIKLFKCDFECIDFFKSLIFILILIKVTALYFLFIFYTIIISTHIIFRESEHSVNKASY